MINEFVNIENNMIAVLIKATVSASQLSSLAFSPRAFAQIRHNDFNIKIGRHSGIRTHATVILSDLTLPLVYVPISKLVAGIGLEPIVSFDGGF